MKEPYWPQSPHTQVMRAMRAVGIDPYFCEPAIRVVMHYDNGALIDFHVDKALDACARDENVDKYPAIGLHMQDIAIATASLAASISMLRRTLGVKETDDDGTNDR